jgi:putative transcriptional regulator
MELAGYQRRANELLTEAERDAVVDLVAFDPTCGDLITGTGGLRKVRVGRGGSGTRGGARVIYYFLQRRLSGGADGALCEERESRPHHPGQKRIGRQLEGDHGVMAKKIKKRSRLADDLFASLDELRDFVAGKKTGVIVHTVTPSDSDARLARHKLGLSQREFAAVIGTGVGTVRKWELGTRRPSGAARTLIEVIKREPKAVRRALGKSRMAS